MVSNVPPPPPPTTLLPKRYLNEYLVLISIALRESPEALNMVYGLHEKSMNVHFEGWKCSG